MKRREFLQTTAAATAGTALLSGLPIGAYGYSPALVALTNATTQSDKVLVIIQLQGGNDGLNMIIPLDQYPALMAARPNIALAQSAVLPLTTATGIHPAMASLHNLYQNGKLGVVQSVGYPNPNFSHFRATDIWTSGSDSNATLTTGWTGRYLDGEFPGFPTGYPNAQSPDPLAISIGSVVSNCVQGPSVNMGMAIASTSSFYQLLSGGVDAAPNTPAGHELTFIRQVVSQTQVYTTAIQAAAGRAQNLSPLYPTAGQNSLADQLKIVAQLVAGGLSTRIYVCTLGGFDTHTLQVPATGSTSTGTHATLLVFGSKVNPVVHGPNPTLPANAGVNDQINMQYDFRSVYISILQDWFQVTPGTLAQLFGRSFPYVPVLRPNALATAQAVEVADFTVYPNPAVRDGRTTVAYDSAGGHVQIVLLDALGREVRRAADQVLARGPQLVPVDLNGLAAGAYYCQVREAQRTGSRLVVVE
jgi:uncharacterized protein (DUF1501 family)